MPAFDPTKLGTQEANIPYHNVDGQALTMDVYYPSSGGPWAGLVFVHGGGWTEGDKAPLPVVPTQAGFLVVSINYRLYPAYRFPAMIEDVKCAIRWLRAHAAELNLDTRRIALIGHSAGGHLAALAGLADESVGWDNGPHPEQSSQVQAVVEMSGPADLRSSYPSWVNDLKASVFGEKGMVSGSPVHYARKNAPPFLIVHGEKDDVMPVEQAVLLHQALTQAGASSQLIILKNAGHGFEAIGGVVTPSFEEAFGRVLAFLASSL